PPKLTVTNKVIVNGKESVLSSSISGFYPVDIDITWIKDGEILDEVTTLQLQRNVDGTYTVNSTVTITPTQEDKNRIFSCRVQHESLSDHLQEDFYLVYGVPPSVNILYKPFKLNTEQTLICHVWGFYPESIAVNWFLNGSLVEATEFQRMNSSEVKSILQFLPEAKFRGAEISCKVEHKTLSGPLVDRLLVDLS
ncbi:hypothetical protein GDO86_018636, partial [Hymenochirus boettgeri]